MDRLCPGNGFTEKPCDNPDTSDDNDLEIEWGAAINQRYGSLQNFEADEGKTKAASRKGPKNKAKTKGKAEDRVLHQDAATKPTSDADRGGALLEGEDEAPERVFVDSSNHSRVTAVFKDGTRRILGILAQAAFDSRAIHSGRAGTFVLEAWPNPVRSKEESRSSRLVPPAIQSVAPATSIRSAPR